MMIGRKCVLVLSLVLGLMGLVPVVSLAAPMAPQQPDDVWWNEVYHHTRQSFYRDPFGAVSTGQSVTLRLRAAKGNLDNATLVVYNIDPSTDHDGDADGTYWEVVDSPSYSDTIYAYYTFVVPAQPSTRTLYYKFRLQNGSDCDWYVDDYKHNYFDHEDRYENGLGNMVNGKDGNPCADSEAGYEQSSFDIVVYDAGYTVPDWAQNAVIYQIMPDRFRNGDPANDDAWPYDEVYGIPVHYHTTWNEAPDDPRDTSSSYQNHWSADFFGGDLQGIIDKLDYLRGIGVTALYLNPIFASPSNHGYDTANYLQINPRYGTLETFQVLATEAHKRGMKLILDGVFNHTGSDSVYFDRYHHWDDNGNPMTTPDSSGACEAVTSIYTGFYNIYGSGGPCYDNMTYESWWGYDTLPLLNENNLVKDFIFDVNNDDSSPVAVIQYWYNQGADGWRFDVADELSHDFWHEFRAQVKYTDTLTGPLYSEVWYEATPWLYGDQMDATMNYRYRKAVLGFLVDGDWIDNDNDGDSTIYALLPSQFDYVLGSIREDYPPQSWYAMMNLMGSHDTNRALYVLRQKSSTLGAALAKMKMMAELQFTYPGAPTIYYGDEVGLGAIDWGGEGVWGAGLTDTSDVIQDDPYNRHSYPWPDESGTLPVSGSYALPLTSLQEVYRILGLTRGAYDVLRTGEVTTLLADDEKYTYAYARTDAHEEPSCAVAIFNRATTTHVITLTLPMPCADTVYYDVLNEDAPYTATGTALHPVSLAALSGAVLVPPFDNPHTPDTVKSLPPTEVNMQAAISELPVDGQTVISATIRDVVGKLLPEGVTVDFAIVDGNGTLSFVTATTNFAGVAVVTYTAPSETTVAVIQAAITAPDEMRYQVHTTIYVGYQAEVSRVRTARTDIGPQTLRLGNVFTVTKNGIGTPIVTMAQFDNMSNASNAASEYVDLHVTNITNVESLTITLPYTDSGADLPTIFWWHTGNWTAVSGTLSWDTGHRWVSFLVLTDSIPSLSQLNGTPFVVAYEGNEPTVLHIARIGQGHSLSIWGSLFTLLTGMVILYQKWRRAVS